MAEAEEVEQIVEPKEVILEVVYTEESIIKRIEAAFPEDPITAVKIARCESHLIPDIQSHHMLNGARERSFGLFQIFSPVWHDTAIKLGLEDYRTSVEENIAMARYIYTSGGNSWQPWSCYSKGMI
jgi:hypothetical protein